MADVTTKPKLSQVSLIFAKLYVHGQLTCAVDLTRIYGAAALNSSTDYSNTLSSVAFAGFVVGMLAFGWLSDKLGRKFGMHHRIFSLLSAASAGAHGSLSGLVAMLSFCRFMLGIGLGAEYPCGSVSASEQSEEPGIAKFSQHRWLILDTNTMLDVGFVIGAFVPLVLYWIFGDNHLRAAWRMSLGLGFIPAMAVFFWRLKMEEPTRYKKSSMKNVRIPYSLIIKRYWKSFLGLSIAWCSAITGGDSSLTVVFGFNVVINLFYIPGTVIGAFVIDYLGPKVTMVVYGIFLSLGEFGPGNCLGVLAAKSGPTAVRGQYYGAVAAVGKVGAFVGTGGFGGSSSKMGETGPFWIGSGLAILSAIVVFMLVKPLTHDGMAEED
ncbi:MFS general substrate transporter [Coniophora puteana RWD-64-598 SS2]|uniref:MFS general substrate transporter n=1 Tax=Coniophora puteana (strain RWD-64-598) TaxID=741705 RepID=A0A5M3N2S7_CONPW|nr:MFS general substrate transporter [Coniophora puteana RWD-64-598 SS2]EIW85587.1 MFS general substrate transporter [Coniophora puteana RWD-64-598 SS2]